MNTDLIPRTSGESESVSHSVLSNSVIPWTVAHQAPVFMGFPGQEYLSGEEFACNAKDTGDVGSIPGLGRSPGEGNGNSLQYFWPEKSHG